ncbi:MAG: AmmeMemoRadiSam system protein A [Candidatus Aminicenantes bacterium]|nr:AmmeMemoRadiSam system protein A [Candidatus Aminicenantes bacterium]
MKESLDTAEQEFLLALARRSIEEFLKTGKRPRPEAGSEKLAAERGAFVTLKVDGQLRGCIGYPLPHKPLLETIAEMAVAAASKDYRFPPLKVEELPRTKIEISVLTLPKPVKEVKEIEVGRHGIIVSKGVAKGLLLPQVPSEYGWDLETFLRHGCLKAGLDENEWRRGANIEVFEAQVFSE